MRLMRKSFLINIGLLLLISGLFWLTQRSPTISSPQQLTQIQTDSINRIHIQRQHNDLLLVKSTTQGDWHLISPVLAKANPNRIQFILDLLNTPVFSQQSDDLDLSPFGLSPPQIQLLLDHHLFEFGNTSPLNKQRYLHHQHKVYLIADRIYPLLLANPSSFLDNQLIPSLSNKQPRLLHVSWIGLERPDGFLSQVEGHWTSSDNTLNPDQIGALLTAWQHTQAANLQIVKQPPAEAGATLSFQLEGDDTPINYHIQFTEKAMILQQHQHKLQYHFPIAIKTQLFPDA